MLCNCGFCSISRGRYIKRKMTNCALPHSVTDSHMQTTRNYLFCSLSKILPFLLLPASVSVVGNLENLLSKAPTLGVIFQTSRPMKKYISGDFNRRLLLCTFGFGLFLLKKDNNAQSGEFLFKGNIVEEENGGGNKNRNADFRHLSWSNRFYMNLFCPAGASRLILKSVIFSKSCCD